MSINNNIMGYDDILKLSNILLQNGFSDKNLTIIIKVKTIELLNKINEDFFYRNLNEDEKLEKKPYFVDEIILNVNGITFKYIVS